MSCPLENSPRGALILLGAIACAGPGAASGGTPPGEATDNQNSPDLGLEVSTMIQEDLRLSLTVVGEAPAAGDAITFELSVANEGQTAIQVDFPHGQRYDFEVFAGDGSAVWQWSDGMFFTMILGRESIEPGRTLEWQETLADGLPAGTYRIVGTLTSMEPATAELSLTIGG